MDDRWVSFQGISTCSDGLRSVWWCWDDVVQQPNIKIIENWKHMGENVQMFVFKCWNGKVESCQKCKYLKKTDKRKTVDKNKSPDGWRGLWSSAALEVDVAVIINHFAWEHPRNRGSRNKLCHSISSERIFRETWRAGAVRHAAGWISSKFSRDPTYYILWPREGFRYIIDIVFVFFNLFTGPQTRKRMVSHLLLVSSLAPLPWFVNWRRWIVGDTCWPALNPRRRSDICKDSWQTNAVSLLPFQCLPVVW